MILVPFPRFVGRRDGKAPFFALAKVPVGGSFALVYAQWQEGQE